ncbi:MAG: acetyltransferase [Segetibacter sp.]|nr:acetyltransferase [Segetibacter sp.]
MGIIIRQIEQKDNPVLAKLIKTVFREFKINKPGTVYTDPTTSDLYNLFKTPGSLYWVAEEDGKLLGGCGIYPTDGLPVNFAELVKFYLLPPSRGKGIGKALMGKCFISAIALGYECLYLESFPEFVTAVDMYEKLGFKHIHKPLGNSGHYACNVWMAKNL